MAGKRKPSCTITRLPYVGSRGLCEVCGDASATRYALTVGDTVKLICPTCKATLRSGIETIDGPDDCY